MTRALLFIAAGALFGLITHVVTLLAIPVNATQDAFSRIASIAEPGRFIEIGPGDADGGFAGLDPTFVHAACIYDLSMGPAAIRVPELPFYFTVSFYDRLARPFFVINDRVAIGGAVEAIVVDPSEGLIPTPAGVGTRVETRERLGFILLRGAVANPSERGRVRDQIAQATCQPTGLAGQ